MSKELEQFVELFVKNLRDTATAMDSPMVSQAALALQTAARDAELAMMEVKNNEPLV